MASTDPSGGGAVSRFGSAPALAWPSAGRTVPRCDEVRGAALLAAKDAVPRVA
ncbi:hypothetical protein [Streptomyces sp. PvR034]|uniref:hypothetical protein n=1 Tax=Streptomyces sp. PvR034 TaxID=3156401 RepID=UPI003396F552